MISIVCPSRGRPIQARRMYGSALNTARGEVEVKFYLNNDDPKITAYDVPSVTGPDMPTAWSWNKLALESRGELIVLGGDDTIFKTVGWDDRLREEMWPDGIGVLAFNDLRSKGAAPHTCVSRKWIDTLGYFCPFWFHHWYVDTWNVDIAKRINRFKWLEDVVLEHMTFKNNKASMDDTYRRIRDSWIAGRDQAIWAATERYRAADAEVLRKCVSS